MTTQRKPFSKPSLRSPEAEVAIGIGNTLKRALESLFWMAASTLFLTVATSLLLLAFIPLVLGIGGLLAGVGAYALSNLCRRGCETFGKMTHEAGVSVYRRLQS